jgi:hypothetical protein
MNESWDDKQRTREQWLGPAEEFPLQRARFKEFSAAAQDYLKLQEKTCFVARGRPAAGAPS